MKNESRIVKDICYHGTEYSDSPNTVVITFTGEDLHRIATAMSVKKEHGFNSIRIDCPSYELFDDYVDEFDDPSEVNDEWRDEGGQLIIFSDSVVFYSQSKWDSSDQIESESIYFEEITEGFKEGV